MRVALEDPLRLCTADDVHRELERLGVPGSLLGSRSSAVFRPRGWVRTDMRALSTRPKNRRRELIVWRWTGGECPVALSPRQVVRVGPPRSCMRALWARIRGLLWWRWRRRVGELQ